MTRKSHFLGAACAIALAAHSACAATVTVVAGTYTENFDNIRATNDPADGWTVRNNASASSLGALEAVPATLRAWSHTSAQFKNVSSTNIPSTSDSAAQSTNTNRALGLSQVGAPGWDPGGSFNFNFSSTNVLLDEITIDLLLLNNVDRSNTFEIQYGIGANPSSFTTIGSWSDPGAFGSTALTFDRTDFGDDLDNQSQAWFRIVSLTASTGTATARDQVGIDNFSITASAVPEPSAMLLGALGAFGVLRRRR